MNEQTFTPYTAPAITSATKAKPRRYQRVVLFGIPIILLLVLALPVLAAYQPSIAPFIPSSLRHTTNAFLLNLPVPRNAEQILIGMSRAPINTSQFTQTSHFKLTTNSMGVGTDEPLNLSLELSTDGVFNLTNLNDPQFDQHFDGKAKIPEWGEYQLSANIRLVNRTLYINLSKAPDEVLSYLPQSDVLNKWYSIELPQDEDLTGLLTNTSSPDAEALGRELRGFFNRPDVLSLITYQGEEMIEGERLYHLELNRTGDELGQLAPALTDLLINVSRLSDPDLAQLDASQRTEAEGMIAEYLSSVTRLKISMWVDPTTYAVKNVTSQTTLSFSPDTFDNSSLYTSELSPTIPSTVLVDMNLDWSRGEWPAGLVLAAPSPSQSLEELVNSSPIGPSKVLSQANDAKTKSDINTLGTAVEIFYVDNGRYPSSLQEVLNAGLMAAIPDSSSGIDYIYLSSADGSHAAIIGTLLTSDDLERPLWIYQTATSDAAAYSYSEYLDIRESGELTETSESDVYGAFDLKPRALAGEAVDAWLKILTKFIPHLH